MCIITWRRTSINNIILNIMPKYTFSQNMVSLNYTSIQKSNKFQVTDIQYEYSYVSLSSSKREGEDNASDFDRFESNLTKADESIFRLHMLAIVYANLSNCWDIVKSYIE